MPLFLLLMQFVYNPLPASGINYESIIKQSEEEYNRLFYDSLSNAYEKLLKNKADSGSRLAEISVIICRNLFSDIFPDRAGYYRYMPSIAGRVREKRENQQVLFLGEGNLLPPYGTVSPDTLILEMSDFQPDAVFWGGNYRGYPPEFFSEDSDLFINGLTAWDTSFLGAGISARKYMIKDISGVGVVATSLKNISGETLPSSYYYTQAAEIAGSFSQDIKILFSGVPAGSLKKDLEKNFNGLVLIELYSGTEQSAAKAGNNLEIRLPLKTPALWEITLLVRGRNTIVHWSVNRVAYAELSPDEDFASALEGRGLD